MIKVIKYNCKDLKFDVCVDCYSLLQYKEGDIKIDRFGTKSVKCPHCGNILILN